MSNTYALSGGSYTTTSLSGGNLTYYIKSAQISGFDLTMSPSGSWNTTTTFIGGAWSTSAEEDPKEVFKKEIEVTLKDGTEVTLTYGELYELNKMGIQPENIDFDKLKKALVVIRI